MKTKSGEIKDSPIVWFYTLEDARIFKELTIILR